ncbi:hypothetical protein I6F21_01925 [Bradyrhizobium sp. NBAIM03]|uniref:hypothetical protein n=1 Tax=Bradyrhizobium TaxID=374 RepID=UPI001CD6F365|nr:hypothetical protein [Bradyrhizobium sp. NBAIM03]MCA1531312.1 hypothetical protein [Bradyrhizobium sp. NBAIM03]
MTALHPLDLPSLAEQLRKAHSMTRPLMLDIIGRACRRLPSLGRSERAARVVLALLELELPMWQVRRIAYDDGEWHCALSRERELPDWLDSAVDARHADLALSLLSAFVEVRTLAIEVSRPSVPSVRPMLDPLYEPVACHNSR